MIFSRVNIFDNIFIIFLIIPLIIFVIIYVFEFINISWKNILNHIYDIIKPIIVIGIIIFLLIYSFQVFKEKEVDIIDFIGFNGGYETINIAGERIQVAKEDLPEKMTRDEAERACEDLGDRWRLPNNIELKAIHNQLREKDKGNFKKNGMYLSSDYEDYVGNSVSAVLDSTGEISPGPIEFTVFLIYRELPVYVRAVRSLP